jgi:hypothetical protein
MATVNLGSIKFKWKGTYAGGTAYTVDDVVSYNGSSYICILASTGNLPTNTTYFEQMSSAGTNGTDLTSTLTTQGDIVYRDGSGLQRLAAGTSGQVLQTGGAGANPSWGTVSSDFVLLDTLNYNSGATTYVDWDFSSYVSADYNTYKVFVEDWRMNQTGSQHYLRIMNNGTRETGTEYRVSGYGYTAGGATTPFSGSAASAASIGNDGSSSGAFNSFWEFTINNPKTTDWKTLLWHGTYYTNNTDWRFSVGGITITTVNELNGLSFSAQDTSNGVTAVQAKLYGIKG